jgi:hypothetical protein
MPSLNKQLQNVEGKKGTSDIWFTSLLLYHLSHSNNIHVEKLLNIKLIVTKIFKLASLWSS